MESLNSLVKDLLSRTPLGDVYRDSLHYALQVKARLPNPIHQLRLDLSASPDVASVVRALRRDGIALLPRYVSGTRLERMQESFNGLMERIQSRPPSPEISHPPPATSTLYRAEHDDPESRVTQCYDPFKYEADFLQVGTDPFVVRAVAGYYRTTDFMLHFSAATRYHPMEPKNFSSFQWHHDECGKRITTILLLTEVTAKDQYMSYLKGSHRLFHSRARFANSRISDADVEKHYSGYERLDCIVPAGTLMMFDTNGIHRGNRSLGAHRDSLVGCYGTAAQLVYPFRIPRAAFASLSDTQKAFLKRNPRAEVV